MSITYNIRLYYITAQLAFNSKVKKWCHLVPKVTHRVQWCIFYPKKYATNRGEGFPCQQGGRTETILTHSRAEDQTSLRAGPVTPQDKALPSNDFKRSLWSEHCRVFLQIYCSFPVIHVSWCFFTECYGDGNKCFRIYIYIWIAELAVITWKTAQHWLLGPSSVQHLH